MYDGDLFLITDNEYVVNAVMDNQPTITYEKKKAKEQKLNTSSFATMDTKSFNTKIGFITNIASTLIAMLYNFPKESNEYKEIKRRISLLRYYQGTAIDSAKGDIFVPPPKYWNKKQKYLVINDDMTQQEKDDILQKNKEIAFNNRICADKKPYFFGYIYPKIMVEYNSHRNNYKKLCKILYKCNIFDLMKKENKTAEELNFIYKFNRYSPLLKNKCIMNILSEYVENIEFDNKYSRNNIKFDYQQLLSGNYDFSDKILYQNIKNIIKEFNQKYVAIISERKTVETEMPYVPIEDVDCFSTELHYLIEEYENKLISLCSDSRKVCDYVIDIYYKYFNTKSKIFIWETFGDIVLENVKSKSTKVRYPVLDENGVEYLGRKYSIKEVDLV